VGQSRRQNTGGRHDRKARRRKRRGGTKSPNQKNGVETVGTPSAIEVLIWTFRRGNWKKKKTYGKGQSEGEKALGGARCGRGGLGIEKTTDSNHFKGTWGGKKNTKNEKGWGRTAGLGPAYTR